MLTHLSRETRAALMLLIATTLWGFSFTWVKAASEGINTALGAGSGAPIGAALLIALRFSAAGLIWFVVDPRSRRGWSTGSVRRSLILGAWLWLPIMAQVLGLGRTTEAVSAFLTSLAVVFVPLIMTFWLKSPPARIMWVAVGIACAGIWMMTGATPTGFGLGEVWGLLGAIGFAGHIIIYNRLIAHDSVARMTAAQFAVTGIGSWLLAAAIHGGSVFRPSLVVDVLGHGYHQVEWGSVAGVLASPWVGLNLLFALVVSTIAAFGLVFRFQPSVTPTRAALVYLAEPIVAGAFAYLMVGRALSQMALGGAALILLANLVAESRVIFRAGRRSRSGSARLDATERGRR